MHADRANLIVRYLSI